MRKRTTVLCPAQRSERVRAMTGLASGTCLTSIDIRNALTPHALTCLPDHFARGHKSLGRICTLRNALRGFKARPCVSR